MADLLASFQDFQDFAKDASKISSSSEKGVAIVKLLASVSRRMMTYVLKSNNYSLKQLASDGLNSPSEFYGIEHYGKDRRNIIRLYRPFNVTSITSVIDNGSVLTSDYYYVDYQNGIINRLRGKFYPYPGAVQVVYTAGFPVNGDGDTQKICVPEDLQVACLTQANYEFTEREPGGVPAGAQTVSRPDGSIVIKPQAWLDRVKDVLDSWKKM